MRKGGKDGEREGVELIKGGLWRQVGREREKSKRNLRLLLQVSIRFTMLSVLNPSPQWHKQLCSSSADSEHVAGNTAPSELSV